MPVMRIARPRSRARSPLAVARIRSTLALQSDLRDLADRVRGLTASELQAEWTRRFAG